jgi:hypothetical protein
MRACVRLDAMRRWILRICDPVPSMQRLSRKICIMRLKDRFAELLVHGARPTSFRRVALDNEADRLVRAAEPRACNY